MQKYEFDNIDLWKKKKFLNIFNIDFKESAAILALHFLGLNFIAFDFCE